jgi:hypothetical protein
MHYPPEDEEAWKYMICFFYHFPFAVNAVDYAASISWLLANAEKWIIQQDAKRRL